MLWESFVGKIARNVLKPVVSTAADIASKTGNYIANQDLAAPTTGASNFIPAPTQEPGTSQFLTEKGVSAAVQKGLQDNIQYDINKPHSSGDMLLRAATWVEDKIISPAITRPASTLALLTDTNSPLYAPGKYEKGFQLSDIARAYNRSEKVSTFVALTQSDLNPTKSVSDVVLASGNIDIANINLWDDQNVQKNFSDNVVGRYFTGLGDFAVGNALIGGALGAVARGGKAAIKAAGLSAKGSTLAKFETDANDGLLHLMTNGERGRLTNTAQEIDQVANSTDINLISKFVSKYSNNERLIPLMQDTSDPAIVRDLLLADKGYIPALERLTKASPSDLAYLGDVPGQIRARNLLNDDIYQPTGDAIPRLRSAFEDAIKKNPEHAKIYDAFFDPEGNILSMGKTNIFPIEPKFATEQISNVITKSRDLRAKAVTRDFSKVGAIEERVLGSRAQGLLTSVVRFTGTYKPLGFVTFSGSRPFDGIVELNAAFDDIKLFSNGANLIKVSPTKTVTAAEYRSKVISDFTSARNTAERNAVLDNLDKVIGHDIARSYDFYEATTINNLQSTLRSRINKMNDHMGQHGFGIDANGRGIMVDAQTQSQIAESYRMGPWGTFEKELIRSKKSVEKGAVDSAAASLNNLYETMTKYWTFDVLARPSYIVKQSWAEPILSAGLSQGTGFILDEIPSMTRNGLKNFNNRVQGAVRSTLDSTKAKAVNNTVSNISTRLEKAIQQRDMLAAESYKYFETDLVSPKMRKDYGDIVKTELKKADKAVENLEIELQSAAKPFGLKEEIPSLASLERRIAYIEKSDNAAFKAKNASAISNAKAAITKAKGELNTLIPDEAGLKAVYKEMSDVYDQIDNVILKDLGKAELERANLFGRSAEFKKRYHGKGSEYTFIGDKYMKIDSLFDENQLGAAFREEFANSRAVALTYAGELTVGTKNSILLRRGPRTVTDINDPLYFEELAYVANRTLRNDPLVKLVLQGNSLESVQKWATTTPGLKYFSQFGDFTEGQIPTLVRNRVGLVNRYLPDARVKDLLLKGEVTSVQLQKILAEDMSRLSALHPLDFDYDMVSEGIGATGLSAVERAADKATSKIFNKLTSPENPVRWSYADKVFKDIVTRKAQALVDQGVSVTVDQLNALRSAARREALQEAEKTFYTVRRKNRAVWASRIFTAFPAASLNAMYRYGRFAIKNPVRMAGFMHNYQSAFRSFGVDQYGNPVTDPLKAQYLVVPGTKELGFNNGKGVMLSARSIGFLVNLPSPSFIATIPMSLILSEKPGAEETMRQIMGPMFDNIFPYGIQKNPFSPLIPSWARDAHKALTGPEGDANFAATVKSVMNYHNALNEMGIESKVTYDQMINEAKGLYLNRAAWSFASPFGVPIKVDTKPMAMFEGYYNALMNKYLSQGNSRSDAMDLAEQEFLAATAPNFPIDRITYKGSTANTYIPATTSAYNRVWHENGDLINSLGSLGKDGSLIGLVTMDIDATKEDMNLSVYNFLKDPKTRLPDGSLLNKYALTPAQEEKRRQINRVWDKYMTLRDNLDAQAQARFGKPLRRIPELSRALSDYANTELKKQSEDWWKEKNGQLAGGADNSFNYARGLYEIVNNKEFMDKHGNSPVWQDAKKFTDVRNAIVLTYQSMPSGDKRKSLLKEAYLDWISTSLGTFHPKVQEIMKRYFEDDSMKVVTD